MVVEVDPELKHKLYAALAHDDLTFKDWLVEQAERYIAEKEQPRLFEGTLETPSAQRGRER